jgi:hypothetical protein
LREQRFARFPAAAAGFGADATVLHFFGVAFADCAADFARLNASPQLCASQFEIGTGEARDDARGRQADIGVIIAIANTRDQLRHVCFGEAGIGAGVAGFRAGIAGRFIRC